MQLRPYQADAVAAVYRHLHQRETNPCIVIPTAGGKTPILATICHDAVTRWQGRVLVVSHVKELLQQAVHKLQAVDSGLNVGVYSAGLGRRDTKHSVVVAGIQSVYKRACELCEQAAFNLVIVDEAHLIPRDGDGMYRTFLADAAKINPRVRVIGLTATPYRLDSGMICAPDGILNEVCYEVGIKELIRDGYLCTPISKCGAIKADTSKLHIRLGEYMADEVEALMDRDPLVEAACQEIVTYAADRKSILIFASGVKHGRHVVRVMESLGHECGFVCGDTPARERDETLLRFRHSQDGTLIERVPLKYLCNVNVLTTGFDAPNIDCVVLLRPTLSPGLYYQMVGRGFRIAPGKTTFLVLDYGGNILRHGPVDLISVRTRGASGGGNAPVRECPKCHSVVAVGYAVCPDCGYQWPPPEKSKHDATATEAGILSGKITDTEWEVMDTVYNVHRKRGADETDPRSMRVDYCVSLNNCQSEWVCFEHNGFARDKAVAWWQARSRDPVPTNSEAAVAAAESGALAVATKIVVRNIAGERFDRIIKYELGEKPEKIERRVTLATTADELLDDIPF